MAGAEEAGQPLSAGAGLPKDLWSCAFQFLDVREHCAAAPTSRLVLAAASVPASWPARGVAVRLRSPWDERVEQRVRAATRLGAPVRTLECQILCTTVPVDWPRLTRLLPDQAGTRLRRLRVEGALRHKQWHKLFAQCRDLRALEICEWAVSNHTMSLLRQLRHLEELTLSSVGLATTSTCTLSDLLPPRLLAPLRALRLQYIAPAVADLQDEHIDYLVRHVTAKLVALDITTRRLTARGLAQLATLKTSLQHLNLCLDETQLSTAEVARGLRALTALRSLVLYWHRLLPAEDLCTLTAPLAELRRLELHAEPRNQVDEDEIDVMWERNAEHAASVYAHLGRSCRHLEHLRALLPLTGIGVLGTLRDLEASISGVVDERRREMDEVARLTNLTSLDLAINLPTAPDLASLASLSRLQRLVLRLGSGQPLAADALVGLASLRLPNLKIMGKRLHDGALGVLKPLAPTLEVLDLRLTRITSDGLERTLDPLRAMPRLRMLKWLEWRAPLVPAWAEALQARGVVVTDDSPLNLLSPSLEQEPLRFLATDAYQERTAPRPFVEIDAAN